VGKFSIQDFGGGGFKNLISSTDNFVSGNVLPFQISMHAQMMIEL